jgi:hypothetical protein
MSFAIFNIISIVSRVSNTLQAPLMAKYVETQIQTGQTTDLSYFRVVILCATLGTAAAGFSMPTFQRLLSVAVVKYYELHSFIKVFGKALSPKALPYYRQSFKRLSWNVWQLLKNREGITLKMLLVNVLVNAIATIAVLACLYAGYLNPNLRATASSMSGVVNGLSVALALVLVDPYVALFSDEVNVGKRPKTDYYRYIAFLFVARLLGTVLAQFLLLPFAHLVLWIVEWQLF